MEVKTQNPQQNRLAIITFLAVIAWLVFGQNSGQSISYDITEVEVPVAQKLVDAGAIIIDVRSENAYNGRHIPGALLFPLAMLRVAIPDELLQVKDKDIVVYCNKGKSVGQEATHILKAAGFTGAVNLKSGIEGWADAGLPVDKNPG